MLTIITVLDKCFSRSKSFSLIAVPLVKIMKHLSLNSLQRSSNFGKRNGSPPARKKQNTPSSLASETRDFHRFQSSCGFFFLFWSARALLQVIPAAAAKHPEQLRLHCCVRLSIRVGGTFNPSSSNFLRCWTVSLKARYRCRADKMYLGCRIAQGKEIRKNEGPKKVLRNTWVTKFTDTT